MKWMKKHKVLTTILVLLLLLILSVFWFIWAKLDLIVYEYEIDTSPYVDYEVDYATETLAPEDMILTDADMAGLEQVETPPQIPESEIWGDESVLNILLLGTDERLTELSPAARSDSMILVSIDRDAKTVKLVSLQRGMGVPVLEGEYEGQYDWLTHIFRYGGAELVRKTVETCFRVNVDYYVRVNMYSMRNIVDLVGGVDITLTDPEVAYFSRRYGDGTITFQAQKGVNHMNGAEALVYARLRSIDSDFRRVERQRKVIMAVVEQMKDASLLTLNDMADQVLPLIQTNMTKSQIAELIFYAPTFLGSEFSQMTIPAEGTYGGMIGMGGRSLFAVDFEVNSEILLDFLYGEDRK